MKFDNVTKLDLVTRLPNPEMNFSRKYTLDLFNFNHSQAVLILEQHLLSDQVLQGAAKSVIVAGYGVLIIAGVLTNLLVSLVIIINPRLRITRNLFIVNLSLSDLMLCLFCMPFTMAELLNRKWNLGTFLCRAVPFVQGITIFVSAATVSAIAIDRQDSVISYNFHRNRRKKSNMLLYTFILWIFSLALSMPIIFSKTVTEVQLAGMILYEKCIEQWPSSHAKALYTLLILLAQLFIPTVVLAVTHLRIKSYLNRSIRRHITPGSMWTSVRLKKELGRNKRATGVLAFISVVFASSWLPWNVFNLMADLDMITMRPDYFNMTFAVCHMVAMSSSVTNPILYGWFNTNIKRELQLCSIRHIFQRQPQAQNGVMRGENTCNKTSAKDIEAFDL